MTHVLKDAIQRIRKPLEYSAKNTFANINRVRDLERTVTTWSTHVTATDLSPAQHALLEQFVHLFAGYDESAAERKITIIQTAFQLLGQLEQTSNETPESPSLAARDADRRDDFPPLDMSTAASPFITQNEQTEDVALPPVHLEASAKPVPEKTEDLTTPIQFVKGVGPKRARLLNKLGIHTVEQALFMFPRRYEDRRNIQKIIRLRPGEELTTVYGVVRTSGVTTTSKQRTKLFELMIGDDTGVFVAKWFNQPYLQKIFTPGTRVVLSGKIHPNRYGSLDMIQPEYEILDDQDSDAELLHTGRIVPIYPLTEGLYQKEMRKLMKSVIDQYAGSVEEDLPESLRAKYRFLPINAALRRIHFPENEDDIHLLNAEKSPAHHRIIFDEFFLLEIGMGLRRQHVTVEEKGIAFQFEGKFAQRLYATLPFGLTAAQKRVTQEILSDMRAARPMNRLLQGDVGSGKTIVALSALLCAIEAGYQGAIMVPTEILAEQHFRKMAAYLAELNQRVSPFEGIRLCLLTGGLRKKEREKRLAEIERGEIQLIVGTHALLQHDVTFHHLGMIVIDEQHKFGVMQRATLKAKGYNPDVLIMTATPIPRTLSLTVYGDLDVSILDELPPGRTPVVTQRFYEQNREQSYRLIAQEIEHDRQVYIVYPLVEESEKLDLKAATEMSKHLAQDIFPQYRVGLVHGRMKGEEKDQKMVAFKNHELDILVSTTVLEVGIDVANATVMLIEHAERFGLSQLHQLRGRVGRGSSRSYCLLMTGFPMSEEARKRLDAMVETTDGFVIAERDLEIRGPGEFFGTKQSGLPDLKVANLVRDVKFLEQARDEAFALIERDPGLTLPQHRNVKRALERRWEKSLDLISVG